MTDNYFEVEEFFKEGIYVPEKIITKIQFHIKLLNPVRKELGGAIIVSKESGYRPEWYEKLKGRSGLSEHCFREKGAVDLTCRPSRLPVLFKLLATSGYKRICFYPKKNFIHADFASSKVKLYICPDKRWQRITR